LLVLSLSLAGAAMPRQAGAASEDPATLQRELDSLRVTYKDDHPDVIRARRALERALEKRRKAAQAVPAPEGAEAAGKAQTR
jgi:hypothetical protein